MFKFSRSKSILAWATLACGLLASLLATAQVKQGIEREAARQFAFDCDQITLKVQERLRAYALILRGGAALYAASISVERNEWRAYVATLQASGSVPGVQGIGFAEVIPPERLATHIERIRAEGFPDYAIRPPGSRALYTSIIYLEPFNDRNLRAFGYDMYSEPVRRAAMEQARDTGAAALSGKVELVQETGIQVQAGALMYVPVYRNGAPVDTLEERRAALVGWAYSPYRMNDLMAGMLGDWEDHAGKGVDLAIYDGREASPAARLFDSKPTATPNVHSHFYQQRALDFNDRHWLLAFTPTVSAPGIGYAPVWWTLAAGLALSGLLFWLLRSVINTRTNAVRIAEALTAEIRQNQELVRESQDRTHLLLNSTAEAIYGINLDGNCTFCNNACLQLLGYRHPQDLLGKNMHWQIHGKHADGTHFPVEECRIFKAFATGERMHVDDEVLWRRDGTAFPAEYWSYPQVLDGVVTGAVVTFLDITERRRAEERLHLAASVFTHAREGIMITDAHGTIIDVNDAFSRITSYSRDESLGQNPRMLSSGRQEKGFYATLWRDLMEKGHWYGEVWNRRKSGEVYAVMETINAVFDAQGHIRQYVALLSDIAHYDALTGLPQRVLLTDRLQQAIAQAQQQTRPLAVACLDLDGFKSINDHHGHEAGDQLLIATATRVRHVLREGDILARVGGDEFVAILPDMAHLQTALPMITQLLAATAQPVPVGECVLQVTASLGITFYPQPLAIDAEQLLRQAHQAMYQAKLAGKGRYLVFDTAADSSVRDRHEGLQQVRRALTSHEFVLHYQPKVNMRTGTLIGAEALIRWQHPQHGLLSPAQFLPLIEDDALAVEIGEWVISTALTQMESWQALGLTLPVSVNVDARQLQRPEFVQRLRKLLAAHPHLRPGDLELEVLETSALADLAHVSQVINACRGIGVWFALDDFGTGYSSLTYLKRLPVRELKLDQSFVRGMLDDPYDLAILNGVLGLAIAFHCQVIAEGVETVEHGELLLQLGCELAQGYGIAYPMPAADLPGWAATWRPAPSWVELPTLDHDDLPLLFASTEHRAWMAALVSHLKGERDTPPSLDHHQCPFGQWLNAQGRSRHGAQPAFQAITPLHQRAHTLAAELCVLHATGQAPQALARLGELDDLGAAVLEQLRTLVQANRQEGSNPGHISGQDGGQDPLPRL